MKKQKIILSLLIFLLLFSSTVISFAGTGINDVDVKLNGRILDFDVKPRIINGRTLVPLRVIFEKLGLQVGWDGKTQTVIGTKENTKITLPVGKKYAFINNKKITLDTAATVINGRTLVPVRFVSESVGADVGWDSANWTVIINTKNNNGPVNNSLIDKYDLIYADTYTIMGKEYHMYHPSANSSLMAKGIYEIVRDPNKGHFTLVKNNKYIFEKSPAIYFRNNKLVTDTETLDKLNTIFIANCFIDKEMAKTIGTMSGLRYKITKDFKEAKELTKLAGNVAGGVILNPAGSLATLGATVAKTYTGSKVDEVLNPYNVASLLVYKNLDVISKKAKDIVNQGALKEYIYAKEYVDDNLAIYSDIVPTLELSTKLGYSEVDELVESADKLGLAKAVAIKEFKVFLEGSAETIVSGMSKLKSLIKKYDTTEDLEKGMLKLNLNDSEKTKIRDFYTRTKSLKDNTNNIIEKAYKYFDNIAIFKKFNDSKQTNLTNNKMVIQKFKEVQRNIVYEIK